MRTPGAVQIQCMNMQFIPVNSVELFFPLILPHYLDSCLVLLSACLVPAGWAIQDAEHRPLVSSPEEVLTIFQPVLSELLLLLPAHRRHLFQLSLIWLILAAWLCAAAGKRTRTVRCIQGPWCHLHNYHVTLRLGKCITKFDRL